MPHPAARRHPARRGTQRHLRRHHHPGRPRLDRPGGRDSIVTLEVRGPFGLDLPGTAVAFKVYTITAEGNEKGSNAVTVERPG